ncbi:hypothetical protein BKA62DRAFT_492490 [Auriculariales sp. MPI-PUGE-AT-0066]|nr:hypothetical protein BKA62DRAFT_492490 [Auriculariales sp. MPI-PUGE-AT-0066]
MPTSKPQSRRQSTTKLPEAPQTQTLSRARIIGSAPSPSPDAPDGTTYIWTCECQLPPSKPKSLVKFGAEDAEEDSARGRCVCAASVRLNGVGHLCARLGREVQPNPMCPDCKKRRMRRARVVGDQTGFSDSSMADRSGSVWSELSEPKTEMETETEMEVEFEADGVRGIAVVIKREETPGVVPAVAVAGTSVVTITATFRIKIEDEVSYDAEYEGSVGLSREDSVANSPEASREMSAAPANSPDPTIATSLNLTDQISVARASSLDPTRPFSVSNSLNFTREVSEASSVDLGFRSGLLYMIPRHSQPPLDANLFFFSLSADGPRPASRTYSPAPGIRVQGRVRDVPD